MGHPLFCSAAGAAVWGERGYCDGSTSSHDSAVSPCFRGCLAFFHRNFPPKWSPSCPLGPSPSNQQKPLPWDCSTIPTLQLPVAEPFRGPVSPFGGMYGCDKNYLILIPFRLSQISCFTLSIKCFSFEPDNCPDVRIGPLLQFLHPLRARCS